MGDGYFYTLSAIAQSFAAIVALNSIFVIYRLQLLRNRSNDLLTQIRRLRFREFGGASGVDSERKRAEAWTSSATDQDLLEWAETYKGDSDIVAQNRSIAHEYNSNNNSIKGTIDLFKTPMIFNSIIIAVSFILLSSKERLLALTRSIELIVWGVVLLGLIGLLITIYSVFKTVSTNGRPASPTETTRSTNENVVS